MATGYCTVFYVLETAIFWYITFHTAIAEAVDKWKAEKEARLAGGGGSKEVEEEEEYIYAVKDDGTEVIAQKRHHSFDSLDCDATNPVYTLWTWSG